MAHLDSLTKNSKNSEISCQTQMYLRKVKITDNTTVRKTLQCKLAMRGKILCFFDINIIITIKQIAFKACRSSPKLSSVTFMKCKQLNKTK